MSDIRYLAINGLFRQREGQVPTPCMKCNLVKYFDFSSFENASRLVLLCIFMKSKNFKLLSRSSCPSPGHFFARPSPVPARALRQSQLRARPFQTFCTFLQIFFKKKSPAKKKRGESFFLMSCSNLTFVQLPSNAIAAFQGLVPRVFPGAQLERGAVFLTTVECFEEATRRQKGTPLLETTSGKIPVRLFFCAHENFFAVCRAKAHENFFAVCCAKTHENFFAVCCANTHENFFAVCCAKTHENFFAVCCAKTHENFFARKNKTLRRVTPRSIL